MLEIYSIAKLQFRDVEPHSLMFGLSSVSRLSATPEPRDPIRGGISANLIDQIMATKCTAFCTENGYLQFLKPWAAKCRSFVSAELNCVNRVPNDNSLEDGSHGVTEI